MDEEYLERPELILLPPPDIEQIKLEPSLEPVLTSASEEELLRKKRKKARRGPSVWLTTKRKRPKSKKKTEPETNGLKIKIQRKLLEEAMPPLLQVETTTQLFQETSQPIQEKRKPPGTERRDSKPKRRYKQAAEETMPQLLQETITQLLQETSQPIQENRKPPGPKGRNSKGRYKQAATETNSQVLVAENKTLHSECNDLKSFNEQLAEENAKLRAQLEMYAVKKVSDESKSVAKKQKICTTVTLKTETLVDLWEQVSSIQLPECKCSQ